MSKHNDNTANNSNSKNETNDTAPAFLCGTMKSEIMSEARRVLTALDCDKTRTVSTDAYYKALAITMVRATVPAELIEDPKTRAAYVARALVVIETLPKNASAMRQAVYEAKKESATSNGSESLSTLC